MYFIGPALAASLAYGSDAIFGKLALDDMPMYIFIFILSFCYFILAIVMFVAKPNTVWTYLKNPKNMPYIGWALVAVIIGTILADICMWYAIKTSSKLTLPIAVALGHTAPIFSLILVLLVFKEALNWKAVAGIMLTVIGCIITVFYSGQYI
jgi:drug/metabolite transporter (DMT)-like permease